MNDTVTGFVPEVRFLELGVGGMLSTQLFNQSFVGGLGEPALLIHQCKHSQWLQSHPQSYNTSHNYSHNHSTTFLNFSQPTSTYRWQLSYNSQESTNITSVLLQAFRNCSGLCRPYGRMDWRVLQARHVFNIAVIPKLLWPL